MEFGIVGLGRMGGNMARRLARKGIRIAVHNRSHAVSEAIAAETGHLAGVSGGVWGLDNGYCIMFGGSDAAAARLKPYMEVLAPTPTSGWLHTGPVGSGHYVKMVHNGIEYGMMQAFAEGVALMQAKPDFELDLAAIAELWRHGSVVRSWLLDLT